MTILECSTVVTNDFAKGRHDPKKGENSYFNGSWEELEQLALDNFDKHLPNPQEVEGGFVVEVPVPAEGFFAGEIELGDLRDGEQVFAEVKPRFPGDQIRKNLWIERSELPAARQVIIPMYQSCALEDKDRQLDANDPSNWEIVSINASTSTVPMQIPFETMCHNDFGSAGGSPRVYKNPSHQLEEM